MSAVTLAWVLGVVSVLLAIFIGLLMFAVTSVRRPRSYERFMLEREREHYLRLVERDLSTAPPPQKKLEDIISEKRKRFINTSSVSFHFANEQQITIFYNDYFKEPTIASLVSEISGQVDAELKGSVPKILESKIGARDLSKWISTIKLPDTSLNGMFIRFQREAITNGQVTLGLEEVDIELTELQNFEETVDTLRTRFELSLDSQLLENQRRHLKQKAAERTLAKLEQATGWVLVEGRFVIEKVEEFYRCSYRHPVNDYLPESAPSVVIAVRVLASAVERAVAGNYAASVGKAIPLRVYGQVWQPVDRSTNTYELQLTPLAIY